MLNQEQLNTCLSYSDVCRLLKLPVNGTGIKKVKQLIYESNLDVSHFGSKRKYDLIAKKCPVCGVQFETALGSRDEKTTCSRACANTYFRSGSDNPNWKKSAYRTTCFKYHAQKCVICGEKKIVEVHHLDENSANNEPSNLIPLCPTHHQYWHSQYKSEVEPKIREYIEGWRKNR